MSKDYKIFVGITEDNELYFLELEKKNHNGDFSMSGFTVEPITEDRAKEQVREGLEDGEMWKMAVEGDDTTLGKDDWIEQVLAIDGELAGFDNSLFSDEIEVNGTNYIFDSRSCGQHAEHNIKKFFVDEKLFRESMKLWNQYHLKELPKNSAAEEIADWFIETAEKQDVPALVAQAVEIWEEEQ